MSCMIYLTDMSLAGYVKVLVRGKVCVAVPMCSASFQIPRQRICVAVCASTDSSGSSRHGWLQLLHIRV